MRNSPSMPSRAMAWSLAVLGLAGSLVSGCGSSRDGHADEVVNSIGMSLVLVPPGSFQMGSPESEAFRDPDEIAHQVTLSEGFYVARTEVTRGQWRAVMGNLPAGTGSCGDECPVTSVSWFDAIRFCNQLSQNEALPLAYSVNGDDVTWDLARGGYRLPTEAEWEYSARAGTVGAYHFGDDVGEGFANVDLGDAHGVAHPGALSKRVAAVASFSENPWGLYDVHGNVNEWCWDWMGDYAPGPAVDPSGPAVGDARVKRGGNAQSHARHGRSAHRSFKHPARRNERLGFRVVRSVAAAGGSLEPDGSPVALELQPANAFLEPVPVGISREEIGSPAVTVGPATGPVPESDEAKALYSLGIAMGRRLAQYELAERDLLFVERGIRDAVLHRTPVVEYFEYADRIDGVLHGLVKAARGKVQARASAVVDSLGREPGAVRTPSGLIYLVRREGTGAQPGPDDRVRVDYDGTRLDGTVFDSSRDRGEPVEVDLARAIPGWREGLQRMREGGRAILVCSPELAYGALASETVVPRDATIIFDVELLAVLE